MKRKAPVPLMLTLTAALLPAVLAAAWFVHAGQWLVAVATAGSAGGESSVDVPLRMGAVEARATVTGERLENRLWLEEALLEFSPPDPNLGRSAERPRVLEKIREAATIPHVLESDSSPEAFLATLRELRPDAAGRAMREEGRPSRQVWVSVFRDVPEPFVVFPATGNEPPVVEFRPGTVIVVSDAATGEYLFAHSTVPAP